jgi:predicted amidohydrolase
MQNEIIIALIQTDLIWKDKKANLSNLGNLISSIEKETDIIVLPEMFSTAFCVDDTSLAEDIHGETVIWLKNLAKQKNTVICGSIFFKENELYFNRFLFLEPNGNMQHYNKHHLFSLVDEDKYLTKGNEKILINYKGWKIQPFICYDIRFPSWCANNDNADIQLYVANWPKKRSHHWKILLQARAIENQCYTIGVNRIGNDFYHNEHDGCSAVFDYTGNQLALLENTNGIEIVTLSKDELEKHKQRYPFWKDK